MTRGDRHTNQHTRAAPQGAWQKRLLDDAHQCEIVAGKTNLKRPWTPHVVGGAGGAVKNRWTSAARALRALEAKGLVVVDPPADPDDNRRRLAIFSYRLTPAGRRAAKANATPAKPPGPKVTRLRSDLHAQLKYERRTLELMLNDPEFLPALRQQLEPRLPASEDDHVTHAAAALHRYLTAIQTQRLFGRRGLERLIAHFDETPDDKT